MSAKSKQGDVVGFLTKLGVAPENINTKELSACPIHPKKGDKLLILPNYIAPGGYHFKCTYSGCKFSGSGIHLAAKVRGISTREAVDLFRPGNALANTLFTPGVSDTTVNSYLDSVVYELCRHDELELYLDQGRKMLQKCNGVIQFARSRGIQPKNLFLSPCSLLHFPLPKSLEPHFNKFKRTDYLLFPYYCGGTLKSITAYCPYTHETKTVELGGTGSSTYGTFMEHQLNVPNIDTLLVCMTEMDALTFTSKFAELHSTITLDVACLRDPVTLNLFPSVRQILLLNHNDGNALTINAALRYATKAKVDVRVIDVPSNIAELRSPRIKALLTTGVPVWKWCAGRLKERHATASDSHMSEIIATAALTDNEKDMLLSELGTDCPDLRKLVERTASLASTKVYGNMLIMKSAEGYRQLEPVNKQLSNFTFEPGISVYNEKGKRVLCTHVKTDNSNDPLYPVEIEFSDLRKPGPIVANIIWEQLMEQGSDFAPFTDSPDGSANFESIVSVFDKHVHQPYANQLGVSGNILTLPNVRLDLETGTAVSISSRNINNTNPVSARAYGALTIPTTNEYGLFRSLIERNSPAVNAMLGVFGHIAYHIHAAAFQGGKYRPRHLILPSALPDYSLWERMLRQAYYIISADNGLPLIPRNSIEFRKFRASCLALQHLPLICRNQGINAMFNEWVLSNELPLIALADSTVAGSLNSSYDVNYMREDMDVFDDISHCELLDETTMLNIRDQFMAILPNLKVDYDNAAPPALIGYNAIRRASNLDEVESDLFQSNYTKAAVNTPEAFFVELRTLLENGDYVIYDRPAGGGIRPDNAIGVYMSTGDVRLFREKSVAAVAGSTSGFNSKHLDEQMIKLGIKSEQADRWVWSVPRAMWDRYMESPINMMPAFTKPKVIPASEFKMIKVS